MTDLSVPTTDGTATETRVLLDTDVVEGLWANGAAADWLSAIASGSVAGAITCTSLAELTRRAPDRRSEIKLTALTSMVESVDLTPEIARRAGRIARGVDSEEPAVMISAVVAATALEMGLPIACVDEEFFTAMGCETARS